MLIAATDYDGTLCANGKIDPVVLDAVRQWRSKGNRFGIATGRDREMILHPVRLWDIPFDFLVCCNGAAIYDPALTLLAARHLNDAAIADILGHPAAMASLHWVLSRPEATFLHILRQESWFPRLGTPFQEISPERACALPSLFQIGLAYTTEEESEQYAGVLNAAFGEHLKAHHNGVCIDITAKGVNKAQGLHDLLEHYGWPEKDLLVIGDGGNDIPMLKRYNGFTVPNAGAAVKAEVLEIYADVGDMLLARMNS
jgi:Cof subfamily protein (haloacid dehalogenase superfamily)